MRATPSRIIIASLLLLLVLTGVCLLSLAMGAAHLKPTAIINELMGDREALEAMDRTILFRVRLPRICLGALVGGILAVGGVVFQALLRNPLAEPFILGISGGAAFGAIIGILMGWVFFPGVTAMAFAGGVVTIFVVMAIARGTSRIHTNTLLLSGVSPTHVIHMLNAGFMMTIARLDEQNNDATHDKCNGY